MTSQALLNTLNGPNRSEVASRNFDQLVALADEAFTHHQQTPDQELLNLAIRHYCEAFDLGPSPETTVDYVSSYFRLHYIFLLRGGTQSDSTITDRYLDKVLKLMPLTHHLRPVLLGLQASASLDRYRRDKDTTDLKSAIETFQDIMDATPISYPQHTHLQMQYGFALHTSYLALHDEANLDLSIRQFRAVLNDCPPDLFILARQSLASALDNRYKLRYDIHDIDLAIEAYAAVVDMLQPQPREYLYACVGYAAALGARWDRKGDVDDLHVALKYAEVAAGRCPPGSQHYFNVVVFYARLLLARWSQIGSIQDINAAIECVRNGMNVGRPDDPMRPLALATLGHSLTFRFLHCGSAMDLEQGVENCYTALSSYSSHDAGARAGIMNDLAFALFSRYQLQGDKMDSTNARSFLRQALELCPLVHPNRLLILNNFARVLGNLGKKNSDISDIERSIQYFDEILDHCYAISRSVILTNLTLVLLHRHSLLGDSSDAQVAFERSKAALGLLPENHACRGLTFLFQSKALIAMFPPIHTIADTKMALETLHAALDAFTSGHPLVIETYRELSRVHFLQHSITLNNSDLEDAFRYLIMAAQYSNGGSQVQLEAAMQWVESTENWGHPSSLEAYKFAIRILDMHLVLKPSLIFRHDIIKTHALWMCADATSCALRSNDLVGAVEMFEHSRGLFWVFMSRLRTSLDELREIGSDEGDLVDEFECLSRQLETPMMMTLVADGEHGQIFRRAQRDWNAVVDKIRSVDGFSRFLLPPLYEDLRAAAIGGPVIILNASRYSCDAVIVLAHVEPIHVAFKEVTCSNLVALSSEFQDIRYTLSAIDPKDRAREGYSRQLRVLLRRLWESVVCYVVRALEPYAAKNSRIWWCPNGVFTSLPIHAANPYRMGEPGLSDVYVSSYTPTLSALIRSRAGQNSQHQKEQQAIAHSFVSIGQPDSAGHVMLPSVRRELDVVRQSIPASIRFTELIDAGATREAVMSALRTHTYAHVACHGEQVRKEPYESYFALHDDDRLTLLDVVQVHSGQGASGGYRDHHGTEFAFLSACKTATGDEKAPDEVMHLAAALQFAGVSNVVGTMWEVDDNVVVHIVEAFYRAMLNAEGVFDPSRAARALRAAMKVTKARVPLEQQMVFIHIGV